MSLHTGFFPTGWKESIITPIPKDGNRLSVGNWRPINNICIPGKIFGKCVYVQVLNYMEGNKLLCNNQHGFRSGKGTDTAVMELLRKLFDNVDKEYISDCLFLDYSKAFTTVSHDIC